jgi:hypothetical protein
MIALPSLSLIISGCLDRIMNALVPASLVRGMTKIFEKTRTKPQPRVPRHGRRQRVQKYLGIFSREWEVPANNGTSAGFVVEDFLTRLP